jgi:hypothetical protein
MTPTVPVPYAIRHLIESNNKLLQQYQEELTNNVLMANEEIMRLLNLDPNDGWRLDMETMSYVKLESNDAPISK